MQCSTLVRCRTSLLLGPLHILVLASIVRFRSHGMLLCAHIFRAMGMRLLFPTIYRLDMLPVNRSREAFQPVSLERKHLLRKGGLVSC